MSTRQLLIAAERAIANGCEEIALACYQAAATSAKMNNSPELLLVASSHMTVKNCCLKKFELAYATLEECRHAIDLIDEGDCELTTMRELVESLCLYVEVEDLSSRIKDEPSLLARWEELLAANALSTVVGSNTISKKVAALFQSLDHRHQAMEEIARQEEFSGTDPVDLLSLGFWCVSIGRDADAWRLYETSAVLIDLLYANDSRVLSFQRLLYEALHRPKEHTCGPFTGPHDRPPVKNSDLLAEVQNLQHLYQRLDQANSLELALADESLDDIEDPDIWLSKLSPQSKIQRRTSGSSASRGGSGGPTWREELLSEAEQVRRSLGFDIHTLVMHKMKMVKRLVAGSNDSESDKQVMLSSLIDEVLQDLDDIVGSLYPKILEHFGLPAALSDILHKKSSKFETRFTSSCEGELDLSGSEQLSVYRMVQEIINNIEKHASAKTIEIEMRRESGVLEVLVGDDGVGMAETATDSRSYGLDSLRDVAQTIGASIEWSPNRLHNRGTEVRICIPARTNMTI